MPRTQLPYFRGICGVEAMLNLSSFILFCFSPPFLHCSPFLNPPLPLPPSLSHSSASLARRLPDAGTLPPLISLIFKLRLRLSICISHDTLSPSAVILAATTSLFKVAPPASTCLHLFGQIVTPSTVVTHLGNIIKPGDICAGYDLTCAQFNDEALESYQGLQLPEVVLVKKGEQPSLSMSRLSPLTFCPPPPHVFSP